MARPVLLFDGDCGFCTRSADWLRRLNVDADVMPWQFADLAAFGISAEQAKAAVQWVDADGTVRAGHHAIAAALLRGRLPLRILGNLLALPGVSRLAALAYRLVARYRYRLPGGTPACAVKPPA
jgi:predicted DCC family thiol-disulfide oxidoreductase YuxK